MDFPKRDLTNQTFDRLTAIKPFEYKNHFWYWECQCECENTTIARADALYNHNKKSCGCLKQETDRMPKGNVIDEINNTYNHLTVIARAGSDKNGQAIWECKCDCGNPNSIFVLGRNLRTGHTTSCGCDRRSKGEKRITEILTENNIPFETEKVFFKYSNGHIAPFDFYVNNQYLIEYDGETHDINFKSKHGWVTDKSIQKQLERDAIKNQWCKDNQMPLIRIPYTQYHNLKIEDLLLNSTTFRVV